jgi:AbrB family looped-hinge helix DNA binding protein
MSTVGTTRMSSKGQVVIPEEIRQRLGLGSGTQFVVVGEGNVVILRTIVPPSLAEFDDLISAARKAARRSRMKKSDLKAATAKVRRGQRTSRSGK